MKTVATTTKHYTSNAAHYTSNHTNIAEFHAKLQSTRYFNVTSNSESLRSPNVMAIMMNGWRCALIVCTHIENEYGI